MPYPRRPLPLNPVHLTDTGAADLPGSFRVVRKHKRPVACIVIHILGQGFFSFREFHHLPQTETNNPTLIFAVQSAIHHFKHLIFNKYLFFYWNLSVCVLSIADLISVWNKGFWCHQIRAVTFWCIKGLESGQRRKRKMILNPPQLSHLQKRNRGWSLSSFSPVPLLHMS